jgi:hypothetical protein
MTNAIKVLLQRRSGFLQLESTIYARSIGYHFYGKIINKEATPSMIEDYVRQSEDQVDLEVTKLNTKGKLFCF